MKSLTPQEFIELAKQARELGATQFSAGGASIIFDKPFVRPAAAEPEPKISPAERQRRVQAEYESVMYHSADS